MINEFKFNGTIDQIGEVQEGVSNAGKAWKKIAFTAKEQKDQYPQTAAFTIFGEEKVDKFLQYRKVGDNVEVSFNIESREYNGKFYTDLQAWKVWSENAGGNNAAPAAPFEPAGDLNEEDHDDLPF